MHRESFKLQQSHPVGIDGKNHIIAMPPFKFLPISEFQKRQKSIGLDNTRALMDSMEKMQPEVMERKKKTRELKEMGNDAIQKRKYLDAEKFYSEAIKMDIGSRPLWTNRGACRNLMKKYEEAISDCDTALSIDPKCTRSITEKGIALLGLRRFDEAKDVFESLRSLGREASADFHLKKLHDIQDKVSQLNTVTHLRFVRIKYKPSKVPESSGKKDKEETKTQTKVKLYLFVPKYTRKIHHQMNF